MGMKRSKMHVQNLQTKSVLALQKEAVHLKEEFEGYLDDLRLFSNPAFWEAMKESQQGKRKKFSSIREMLAELDR